MSANNCSDDLSNQNQERYLLNGDNSDGPKSFNNFNGITADSDNENNSNMFKYKHLLNVFSDEPAPSTLNFTEFKGNCSPYNKIFEDEPCKYLGNSNDISISFESENLDPYSSESKSPDSFNLFNNDKNNSYIKPAKLIKSSSLNCCYKLKSARTRVCHSAATSPYPCRVNRKYTRDLVSPINVPNNPPISPLVIDNSADEGEDDYTIYSNNNSMSVSSFNYGCESIQLIGDEEPTHIPPLPLEEPQIAPPLPSLCRRNQQHQQQQLSISPLPFEQPQPQPLQQQQQQQSFTNNQFSIRNEPIPVDRYYPPILPKFNNNNNNDIQEIRQVKYGSCRCESGRCSNGNCGCLKNGLECGKECYCRMKGMICENGKEKRLKKRNESKPIKCSCTKSGCSKGKCSCKKHNITCSRDCTCTCNLKKYYI